MARTFAIGDIHGCHASLCQLWQKISPLADDDTVVFLGDYIDRGPASRQVIDMILALRQAGTRVVTLMGNHEQMLLDYLQGRDAYGYLEVGGVATLASYGYRADQGGQFRLPSAHEHFFQELLPYWQDRTAIFVHAGLKPGCPLAMQPRTWLYWAREELIGHDHDFGKLVVYGHTPAREVRIERHRIGIDTGAVYGWQLTCLVLPDREFVQVPGEAYWPPGLG